MLACEPGSQHKHLGGRRLRLWTPPQHPTSLAAARGQSSAVDHDLDYLLDIFPAKIGGRRTAATYVEHEPTRRHPHLHYCYTIRCAFWSFLHCMATAMYTYLPHMESA